MEVSEKQFMHHISDLRLALRYGPESEIKNLSKPVYTNDPQLNRMLADTIEVLSIGQRDIAESMLTTILE